MSYSSRVRYRVLNRQGMQVDDKKPKKLRQQMEQKLGETLEKLNKQKKNLAGLKRLKDEQDAKIKSYDAAVMTIFVEFLKSRLLNPFILSQVYKARVLPDLVASPPRSSVPSTSNLVHPILTDFNQNNCISSASPSSELNINQEWHPTGTGSTQTLPVSGSTDSRHTAGVPSISVETKQGNIYAPSISTPRTYVVKFLISAVSSYDPSESVITPPDSPGTGYWTSEGTSLMVFYRFSFRNDFYLSKIGLSTITASSAGGDNVITLYEADGVTVQSSGFSVVTDRATGTSYLAEPETYTVPEIINTEGLKVEHVCNIDFDPETAEVLKMGKRTKKAAANEEATSPKKQPKGQANPADDSTGDAEFYDPNETVYADNSKNNSNMSTDNPETPKDDFFYKDQEEEGYKNQYRQQDDDSMSDISSSAGNMTPTNQPGTDLPSGATGDSLAGKMDLLDTPSAPIPAQVQLDLIEVRKAVEKAGGLVAQKAPDFDKVKPRIGQELEVLNETLDIGDEIFLPERPAEHTLPKLTSKDLLPPSSTAPIPLEYEHGEHDHECVQERRIEFLVMKKSMNDKTIPVGFLEEAELQKLFDTIRNNVDDIQIMDTVLWIRVEKATTISSMMLCTVNYRLFNEIRHLLDK